MWQSLFAYGARIARHAKNEDTRALLEALVIAYNAMITPPAWMTLTTCRCMARVADVYMQYPNKDERPWTVCFAAVYAEWVPHVDAYQLCPPEVRAAVRMWLLYNNRLSHSHRVPAFVTLIVCRYIVTLSQWHTVAENK